MEFIGSVIVVFFVEVCMILCNMVVEVGVCGVLIVFDCKIMDYVFEYI